VGLTITSLVFDAHGTVSCGFLPGSPMAMCAVAPLAGGDTKVTFFDGSIPFHEAFSLEFGAPANPFPHNSLFSIAASTASSVPEPGTMVLLGTGLLCFVGLVCRKSIG
jgi:hypothetical protein